VGRVGVGPQPRRNGPHTYVLGDNGQERELPRPNNPYATKALVKA